MMFSGLASKLVLRKVGITPDTFSFTSPAPARPRSRSSRNDRDRDPDEDEDGASPWPAWMSVKALPMTVQPWLAPPPPPIPLGKLPNVGDRAPLDRDRRLVCGGGKRILVVFLRCVGCAFAQKTFLALRTLANRHQSLTCIAVSHSSGPATKKWLDLLGGPWAVEVLIDEDLSLYAAWGLGASTVWSVLNPATQIQAWKEKGWLGSQVADAMQRKGGSGRTGGDGAAGRRRQAAGAAAVDPEESQMVLGNKWQSSGAWAVDGKGVVVWGGMAERADELMDLEEASRVLRL